MLFYCWPELCHSFYLLDRHSLFFAIDVQNVVVFLGRWSAEFLRDALAIETQSQPVICPGILRNCIGRSTLGALVEFGNSGEYCDCCYFLPSTNRSRLKDNDRSISIPARHVTNPLRSLLSSLEYDRRAEFPLNVTESLLSDRDAKDR